MSRIRIRISNPKEAESVLGYVNPSGRYEIKASSFAEIKAKRKIFKGLKKENNFEYENAKTKKHDTTKQRFIITWAQIDTPIHKELLKNIEAYAVKIYAEIQVIAGRYKNPNSLETSKQVKNKETANKWSKEVIKYLTANRHNLHKYLSVLADVKVQPTAMSPLTGMNGLTGLESCIIGHPHLHFKSLPVLPTYPNKVILTTGALTKPNYTDTKIGKRSEFNHALGFAVVELDGEHFHVRQVSADSTGSFYDLNHFVSDGKVMTAKNFPAFILGDLHLGVEDKFKIYSSFKLIDKIGFKQVILHDVFDGMSINHHELKNPFLLLQRERSGELDLASEIAYMLKWFNDRKEYNFVSIASNHNDFLDRWLMSNDWRNSPNKELYLRLASVKVKNSDQSVLKSLLSDFKNVKSVEYGESYRLWEWELALHGDRGGNGSRGSANQFKELNTKTATAHSHTPSRQLGNMVVGTSTKLNLGYNVGLCGWMQSDAIIYPNGKASLINFVNGKFTTLWD